MIIAIAEPKDYSPKALEIYKELGEVHLGRIPEDVDIIVTRFGPLPPLKAFPNLKIVACPATSTEHIESKEGVEIISLEGEREFLDTIVSTTEHTIGLLIALSRNYKKAFDSKERVIGHRLNGKNLGIIGCGRVGGQVGYIAIYLGMYVSSVDKGWEANLPSLLGASDFVSLHIPLAGNEGFFTKEMFRQMQSTAYLINTSRSGIIEENALLYALENKEIAGAAVDFTDDPLLLEYAKTHDNLILTNHLGGATYEDMQSTEEFVANKIKEKCLK